MKPRIAPIALALAIVLVTAGWPAGGGAADKAKSGGNSVTLNALFVRSDPSGSSGGTNPVTVHLEKTGAKDFRVGFTEDEVAGTGDQWRAAGWNAATVATILTGSPLTGNQLTFDVTGRIDGPSAGALMTVGILSLLRGDKIKRDVTMTGTINPDGTVGPVGGIPYKVDGVKKAKKKRMLIPIGQRNSADDSGALVDVFDIGRRQGIAVTEVGDIYDVYKQFTGKTLPRPQVTGDVKLNETAYEKIKAKVTDWQAQFQSSISEFDTLSPELKDSFGSLAEDASAANDRATELSDQGLQAGAYDKAIEGAALANAAVKAGRALQSFDPANTDAFVSQIESSAAISGKVEALFATLKATKPKTVTDAAALVDAYSQAVDALSLSSYADNLLGQIDDAPDQETAISDATLGSFFYEFAGSVVAGAKDVFEVGQGLGGPKLAKKLDLKRIADFFRKAAEANLNAFDTVVIADIANENQANLDVVKARFGDKDLEYALATSSVGVLSGALDDYLGDAQTAAFAKLGGAVSLYSRSSELLAKYYSLQAELDEDLNVTGIGRETALVASLDLGANQVKRSVGVLTAKKVQPDLVVAGYEVAGVNREGDASQKLDALGNYWSAYVESRVLAYLGGFPTAGIAQAPAKKK